MWTRLSGQQPLSGRMWPTLGHVSRSYLQLHLPTEIDFRWGTESFYVECSESTWGCDNSASVCGYQRHPNHHLIIQAGIETVRAARDRKHRLVCDSQSSLRRCTLDGLLGHWLRAPTPTVSESGLLGWGRNICISSKLAGDPLLLVPGLNSESG